MAHLFMCPPDHFEVAYAINPWMDPDHWAANRERLSAAAQAEWANLKATYERLGHRVTTMTPAPGLPDMVFTANAAIVLNGRALLASFRHPARQKEQAHYARFFERLKARGDIAAIHRPVNGEVFEGAGDAVWDPYRKLYWVGYSKRTTREAVDTVAGATGVEAVPLKLVADRFYHLDVALAPLSRGHVIHVPEAFDDAGRAAIAARLDSPDRLIAANAQDIDGFAVNAVNLGDDIVTAHCSDALRARLTELGYRVHVCPLPTFKLAGGGAFCLTLRLDNQA